MTTINTNSEINDIIIATRKEERLIAYSLVCMLRSNFLSKNLPDWKVQDSLDKEESLRIYIDICEMFKEHYLEVEDD